MRSLCPTKIISLSNYLVFLLALPFLTGCTYDLWRYSNVYDDREMRFEADENEILIHKENPENHLVAIRYNAIANKGKLPESVKKHKKGCLVFPFTPKQKYQYEIDGHIPSSIQEVSVKLNERDIKDKPANISGKIAIKYTIPVPRVEFISEEDEISVPQQNLWVKFGVGRSPSE
jgi:hypothetical protein